MPSRGGVEPRRHSRPRRDRAGAFVPRRRPALHSPPREGRAPGIWDPGRTGRGRLGRGRRSRGRVSSRIDAGRAHHRFRPNRPKRRRDPIGIGVGRPVRTQAWGRRHHHPGGGPLGAERPEKPPDRSAGAARSRALVSSRARGGAGAHRDRDLCSVGTACDLGGEAGRRERRRDHRRGGAVSP